MHSRLWRQTQRRLINKLFQSKEYFLRRFCKIQALGWFVLRVIASTSFDIHLRQVGCWNNVGNVPLKIKKASATFDPKIRCLTRIIPVLVNLKRLNKSQT